MSDALFNFSDCIMYTINNGITSLATNIKKLTIAIYSTYDNGNKSYMRSKIGVKATRQYYQYKCRKNMKKRGKY